MRRRTGTGQCSTDRRICRGSRWSLLLLQRRRAWLLYSQHRLQSQYRFAPARGAQSRGTNEASFLSEWGDRVGRPAAAKCGRVGGACGQGIDGEGPAAQALCPWLSAFGRRKPTGRRVLSCEGPASTMGPLAWDCEACGRHSASGTRAGAAAGAGAHLHRAVRLLRRAAAAHSKTNKTRRLDLVRRLDLARLSVCSLWCPGWCRVSRTVRRVARGV